MLPSPLRRVLLVAAVSLVAAGCGSDRTYPAAGDYPEVRLAVLADQAPGRYNALAYVAAVRPCPQDAACLDGSVLELEEDPLVDAAPVLLAAEATEQFTVRARYRMSVEVGAARRAGARAADRADDEDLGGSLTLLGYDRL